MIVHAHASAAIVKDTNDVFEEFWKVEFSSFLNGGNDSGKDVLLSWPVVLNQHQQLTEGRLILRVRKCNILQL